MLRSEQAQELADAVVLLACAMEGVAGRLDDSEATELAQIARQLAEAVSAATAAAPRLVENEYVVINSRVQRPGRAPYN